MGAGCPRCYSERFITSMLTKKENGELVCSTNPRHIFLMDDKGFPRRKKEI